MLNLPEPDYYAVSDSDIRPLLMHYRKEVEMHLKQLEKEGGRPVPWEGSVRGLYAEEAVRRIVAAAVAEERERLSALVEAVRDANCDAEDGNTFRLMTFGQERAWMALLAGLQGPNTR